jgi:transcriptional regulator with XRE-family HTH domain
MNNRDDVQQFLTALRARITPDTAGLTWYSGERRVPGLRREEVAQLAGVSTAYYTRMERGDLSGVSESVLFALVRALQLDEAEKTHLFDLARAATGPRRAPRTKPEPRIPPRLAQLLDTMRDVPALALTRLGTPVASNALGRALFPHLFPDGATPLTDRALASLVGDLATRSEDFRTWWGGHTVRIHTSGTKRINHPIVGDLAVGYDVLALQSTPGLNLTTYLPEPGSPSADAMAMLQSWTAEAGTTTASKGSTR